MSIAGANDHESWGISLESASSSYTAFYAVQTGYESTQNPLTHPAGVIGTEQTFSPTIREGGNCLEDSTFYANDNVTQSALFTVFSFCLAQPNFIFTTPIASAFVSQYEGRLPNGEQAYVVETFTPDTVPTASSTWYTVLFNFATQRWDVVISAADSAAIVPSAAGWDFAETYFAPGQCPSLAPSGSSVVAYYDATTSSWKLQQGIMTGGLTSQVGGGANLGGNPCFLPAGSQPPSLQFLLENPNYNWVVTSPD